LRKLSRRESRHPKLTVSFTVAFLLIGFPSLHGPFIGPRLIITRVATWAYAIASAAGFLQFGLNFGEEAGAATEVWITRACVVQGLQQIWGRSTHILARRDFR
jgi:alpha-1,3-glucan synthase